MGALIWPVRSQVKPGWRCWLGRGLHWIATTTALVLIGTPVVAGAIVIGAVDPSYGVPMDSLLNATLACFAIALLVYAIGRLLRHLLARE